MEVIDTVAARRPRPTARLRAVAHRFTESVRTRLASLPYDYPPALIVSADVALLAVTGAAIIQRHEYFPTVLPLLAMFAAFLPVPLYALFDIKPYPVLLKSSGLLACALFLLQPVPADFAPFVLVVVAGEVAAVTTRGMTLGFTLLAIAELIAFDLAGHLEWGGERLEGLPMYVLGIVLGTFVGMMLQYQRRFLYQERENQAIRAGQAADEERRRIAREVHDVIAHSLSITLLHLTAARRALQTDEDVTEAVEALVDAERLGRQAMADIRRTVGMLDTSPAQPKPEPGAADIDELVGDFRRAGLTVDYQRTGDLAVVTGAVGHALYRIGQESLANVAKHAPGAAATVRLDVTPELAALEVRNALPLGPPPRLGTGMGVRGMRKRTELLGGTIRAGIDDDGWTVHAQFPLKSGSCGALSTMLPGLLRPKTQEDQ
ncbi:sensor histidine kinase [Nocardia sp. GTS18]|uniref:sensor histidine kinase n=1 Tax=Nocardia sp. GTS18 TaxID=1778064 RepID=UPI0015EE63AD|nr:histidine kinase [Nocardia sp. GTS18]